MFLKICLAWLLVLVTATLYHYLLYQGIAFALRRSLHHTFWRRCAVSAVASLAATTVFAAGMTLVLGFWLSGIALVFGGLLVLGYGMQEA